ncbi:MAG: hypothetical protein KDE46_17075, partial [Caldilineaceae bacterium]|nr:hypothetical protein [Caldilineaceae bacterium]
QVITPQAVTLKSFQARLVDDTVVVTWETSLEIDTFGFHVDVSGLGISNSVARLTSNIILSKGPDGGEYEFTIPLSEIPGQNLGVISFWLKETEISGAVNVYGPATLVLRKTSIYLPTVLRVAPVNGSTSLLEATEDKPDGQQAPNSSLKYHLHLPVINR